jgi:O-antigen/teichoic acid export membrane protein
MEKQTKNYNAVWASICSILVLLLFLLYFTNKRRIERMEKDRAIEAAKANFKWSTPEIKGSTFDSIYAKYDTVFFYRNGVYQGKSVITREP